MMIDWVHFLTSAAPWLIPLVAACLILGVGSFLKKWQHEAIFLIAFFSLLVAFGSAWEQWSHAGGKIVGMFIFDPLSYFFALLFNLAGLLTLLISYPYWKEMHVERPEYYALLLFAIFGMGCMAAGTDLILVFIGLEVMSVALYVLTGFHRTRRTSVEAALKYFLVGAFASGFLLLGIAFMYGATGTTDLPTLFQKGAGLMDPNVRWFSLLGYSLLAVGIAFKMAIVPFHFWAADVYEGAPVAVTSFMATAVKAAAFAVLLRLTWAVFQWEPVFLKNLIWMGAVLTMTIGNLSALYQKNLKRMLAFSSVAHAGYLLIPLTIYTGNNTAAVSSICFYLIAYVLMTTGAFAVITALTGEGREHSDITELAGVGLQKPWIGFALTFFMLSLAGIPPTLGFFGKYYLFLPAIHGGQISLVVIALLNSVVSVYYYLRPVVLMYFGTDEREVALPQIPPTVVAVILLCLLGVGYFGLAPSQLLSLVNTIR